MAVYGYCRISTPKQNIERQIRNILQYDSESDLIQEVYSGKTTARPEFNKLLKRLQEGDTLICDSVSRFSRNSEEGFNLYKELYTRGVRLVFLKEPHINTDTYKQALEHQIELSVSSGDQAADKLLASIADALNEYIFSLAERQIKIAFDQSQKEVDDLSQRTKEGIKTAKLKGHKPGRVKGQKYETKKYKKCREIILKYSNSYQGDLPDDMVIKLCGINRGTYYIYKRTIREELERKQDEENGTI